MQDRELALGTFVKLARALRSVERGVERRAPLPQPLTIGQFGVLEALLHKGPMRQCDIAGRVLSSHGNMTMIIDNLGKAGLVTRVRDDRDRRGNIVELTAAGRSLITEEFERHADAIRDAMAVLDAGEQRELSRLCRKLGLSNEATEV